MAADAPRTLLLTGAMLVGLASAIGASAALSALARPSDYAARLRAVTERVSLLETSSKSPAPRLTHGREAACPSLEPRQLAAIEQRVGGLVTAGGLTLDALVLTPGDQPSSRLVPITLRLEATGPYDKVAAVLGELSALAPSLFVDRLDLKDRGGATQLLLASKVYCWRGA